MLTTVHVIFLKFKIRNASKLLAFTLDEKVRKIMLSKCTVRIGENIFRKQTIAFSLSLSLSLSFSPLHKQT